MKREYITEIKEFYNLIENKSLSTGQIALWHALMYINNKCYWEDDFSVSNIALQLYTGLSRSGISKARNELKQKGLIDFTSGKTGQTATYTIKKLSGSAPQSVQESVQVCTQAVSIAGNSKDTSSKQNSSTLKRQDTDKDKTKGTPIIPFEGELREKFDEWLAYKTERGQKYKPTGLRSLIKKIEDGVRDCGEAFVISAIDNSISNNWQGLFFDRAGKQEAVPVKSSNPFLDMLKGDEVL